MYIVAIAWIYVVLLMALAETNVVAGVMTFVFYGVLPLALLLWLFGTPIRRRRSRGQEAVDQRMRAVDAQDAEPD